MGRPRAAHALLIRFKVWGLGLMEIVSACSAHAGLCVCVSHEPLFAHLRLPLLGGSQVVVVSRVVSRVANTCNPYQRTYEARI